MGSTAIQPQTVIVTPYNSLYEYLFDQLICFFYNLSILFVLNPKNILYCKKNFSIYHPDSYPYDRVWVSFETEINGIKLKYFCLTDYQFHDKSRIDVYYMPVSVVWQDIRYF